MRTLFLVCRWLSFFLTWRKEILYLFYKTINSIERTPPSGTTLAVITSQRLHLQIPSYWRLELQHVNLGGQKHSVLKIVQRVNHIETEFFACLFVGRNWSGSFHSAHHWPLLATGSLPASECGNQRERILKLAGHSSLAGAGSVGALHQRPSPGPPGTWVLVPHPGRIRSHEGIKSSPASGRGLSYITGFPRSPACRGQIVRLFSLIIRLTSL
ncbi:uncharacterized protein [Macaca nemestrina]|uniref:uncharacterized protein n=1 Tax=Macaca nemestrina TaxID=9545 RepID=UPI0039B99BDF